LTVAPPQLSLAEFRQPAQVGSGRAGCWRARNRFAPSLVLQIAAWRRPSGVRAQSNGVRWADDLRMARRCCDEQTV
jgi:hypothetical protein